MFADENKGRILEALEGNPKEALMVAREFQKHTSGEIKYVGAGIESVVHSIGGGKVAKLSMRSGKPGFTPPRKLKDILRPISRVKFNKTLLEVTHEAKMGGKADDLAALDIRSNLSKRGYNWTDAAARNVGEHGGRVKIIDYGHIKKSTLYRHIKDYGLRKGLETKEISDLVRRRSRTTIAIQPPDAAELRKIIDLAASNRRARAIELLKSSREITKAVMKTGATRAGAGIATNIIVRTMKSL